LFGLLLDGAGADNVERFERAMKADLGRPSQETVFIELGPIVIQAMNAYKNVSKWAAPDGVPFNINTFALKGRVLKDPHGVALIIGPFNYPLVCVSLRG
jgi:aldehyde dehydrogenase (NAD+)